MAFGTEEPPEGYLELNGAILQEYDYPDLIAAAPGFAVSNGDGTFTLADLRGRFLRGLDPSGAVDPGGATRAIGDEQLDALQNIPWGNGFAAPHYPGWPISSTGALQVYYHGTTAPTMTGTLTGWRLGVISYNAANVARVGTETRPRNVAVLYCIKY
jgi:hypothetical protein